MDGWCTYPPGLLLFQSNNLDVKQSQCILWINFDIRDKEQVILQGYKKILYDAEVASRQFEYFKLYTECDKVKVLNKSVSTNMIQKP